MSRQSVRARLRLLAKRGTCKAAVVTDVRLLTAGRCPVHSRPVFALSETRHDRDATTRRADARGAGRRAPGPRRHAAGAALAAGPASRDAGRWALPGGLLGDDEDVEASCAASSPRRSTCGSRHVEQLAVFSAPGPGAGHPRVATAFLGLVPSDADPPCPPTPRWHPVDALPETASTTPRSSRGPATGCAPSSPTPTSASRWRPRSSPFPSCATTTRPRSATGLGDQPAAGAGPPRRARADRRTAPPGPLGRPARRRCSGSPTAACG